MSVQARKKSRKRPKWRRRPDERPTEIADAALEVFARGGFTAARMDDIARKAGVSKGTIYLYYPSKEDLLVASVENRIRENQSRVFQLFDLPSLGIDGELTRSKARSIISRALGLAIDILSAPDTRVLAKVLLSERRQSRKLREKQKQLAQRGSRVIAGFLRSAHNSGAVNCPEPELTARTLMGMVVSIPIFDEILGGKGSAAQSRLCGKDRRTILNFALRGLGLDE